MITHYYQKINPFANHAVSDQPLALGNIRTQRPRLGDLLVLVRREGQALLRGSLRGRKLGEGAQGRLQGRGDGERDQHPFRGNHENRGAEGSLRILRQARRERELDQRLQAPHKSGSLELPSVHRQLVQATFARCGPLVDGHLEEEASSKRSTSDATRYFAVGIDQDRRQGQRAPHESQSASGLGASGTTLMARTFSDFRRRS